MASRKHPFVGTHQPTVGCRGPGTPCASIFTDYDRTRARCDQQSARNRLRMMTTGDSRSNGRRRTAGFTLVETMVALLVLSVGMIGIAALHGQALSYSGTALNRSSAILLAGDIADRIRVNRTAQLAYGGAPSDNHCDRPTGNGGIDCSPAEMAAHDLFAWQTQAAQRLPGGQGSIDVDTTTNPPTYTVTLAWNEPYQSAPVAFVVDFQLPVY
jgi:type IV pilus assembly protein PilV